MKKYKVLACGGTFDLLHKGHKSFLKKILENSEKVVIGLTSDSFGRGKKHEIESFEERRANLEKFLSSGQDNYRITEITDIYGPLLSVEVKSDAIAVTQGTKSGAAEVNRERARRNLSAIPIIEFEMERAEDGKVISSTRIRNGEINRDGRLYVQPMWQNKALVLPDDLREELSEPFGKILSSVPAKIEGAKTICVGDVTVGKFNENNLGQFLSIVDFNVQRKREFSTLNDLGFAPDLQKSEITNRHGTISTELFKAVLSAFETKIEQVIVIDGEEDLAVMPVALRAPLNFRIYYGQPSNGLVEILVTEEIKEKVFNLVNKFHLE